jgi:SSS family solute:Na+ symporter
MIVGVAVSLFTTPKPDDELKGLVWSLTPRPKSSDLALEDAGWFRSPMVLGMGVLVITLVLYIVFW